MHEIEIKEDSLLYNVVGQKLIGVNSTHHQAVKDLAPTFFATAWAKDGIVEAIQSTDLPIHAVQFHPERLIANPSFIKLF